MAQIKVEDLDKESLNKLVRNSMTWYGTALTNAQIAQIKVEDLDRYNLNTLVYRNLLTNEQMAQIKVQNTQNQEAKSFKSYISKSNQTNSDKQQSK
jgi:hypothetical protein